MTQSQANCIQCVRCGKEAEKKLDKRGHARTPRGWKPAPLGLLCPGCFDSAYTLRAVSFPIIGPLDSSQAKQFWQGIGTSWKVVTQLSNWLMTECVKLDVGCAPGLDKLPGWEIPYLYQYSKKIAPEISPQSWVAIERIVKSKYGAARRSIHNGESSVPTFRYPQPYPLPAVAWSVRWLSDTEKVPIVSFPLCGVRYEVRLKGGQAFLPQRRDLETLIDGLAMAGHLIVVPKGEGAMCKLVMYLPKRIAKTDPERTLIVATDSESLLIGSIGDQNLWRFNADHVRRWVGEHEKRLMRLREDAKANRRIGEVSDPATFRARIVEKHHNRMDSLSHQVSSAVVRQAMRMKCSKILFDGRVTNYVESFPWFKLRTMLEQKADAAGLEFAVIEKETKPSENA